MNIIKENQEIVIYKSKDGQVSFNVNVFEKTVWLTQQQMAELFGRTRVAITQHIGNIFKEGELEQDMVCKDFLHTTKHGAIKGKEQNINVKYYNLDVIISVGYRVKSQKGTQFRIWATQVLNQYLINGYAIDEDRIRAIIREEISGLKSNITAEVKDEIKEIYKHLLEIAKRPIIINNHNKISIASNKLEDKAIKLLDQLIKQLKSDTKLKAELEEIKQDLKISPKDKKTKSKIINFFNKLGDSHSDVHKTIKGAGVAGKIIKELVKLGEKLKDLIS